MWQYRHTNELYHHGVIGMKWGVRRYQNKDGSLTPAGKKRYSDDNIENNKSRHRAKLEAKYRSKGETEAQAEAHASKRIKTEKMLAAAAGITVAAAASYAVAKNTRGRTDDIIRKAMEADDKVKKQRLSDIKNRRTLSDEDIKKKIERLKLEKQLKDLSEEDVAPGKKAAKEIMSSAGKKVLAGALAGATAYAVKTAMTREFNIKEAANYMAPNPNKKK